MSAACCVSHLSWVFSPLLIVVGFATNEAIVGQGVAISVAKIWKFLIFFHRDPVALPGLIAFLAYLDAMRRTRSYLYPQRSVLDVARGFVVNTDRTPAGVRVDRQKVLLTISVSEENLTEAPCFATILTGISLES